MDMPLLQQVNNSTNTSSVNAVAAEPESFWGKDGFTFGDVVDMFNPLHHFPVVSKYYREQADDDACEGSRLIGGALFGGLFGGAAGILSSLANSAVRHETHQDVSEHLLEIADESFDNLADDFSHISADGSSHISADGSLNHSTNSTSNTVADAFLYNEANGFLYAASEGASHTIETQINRREVKSRLVASNSDTINPFFAQILDEYSNEQSASLSLDSLSTQRSREWGKV